MAAALCKVVVGGAAPLPSRLPGHLPYLLRQSTTSRALPLLRHLATLQVSVPTPAAATGASASPASAAVAAATLPPQSVSPGSASGGSGVAAAVVGGATAQYSTSAPWEAIAGTPSVAAGRASDGSGSAGSGAAAGEEDGGLLPVGHTAGHKFRLSPAFVAKYASTPPPFGFNGLGEFVYQTRYARVLPDGSKESWFQTVVRCVRRASPRIPFQCVTRTHTPTPPHHPAHQPPHPMQDAQERVVNGTYNMQKRWIEEHDLGWNPWRAQRSAQEMFDRIFHMKFMPPGRGLWAMGSPMTEDRMLFAALNNCAFVSTDNLRDDPTRPFTFLMDAAMLGVGVGFDTAGAGSLVVKGAKPLGAGVPPPPPTVIADSREGWVASVRDLLAAHFAGRPRPVFDYSRIRPAGSPIKGFGGTASGPDMLARLHDDIDAALGPVAGKPITVTAIVDIMNMIGRCIVSGDVRQTAEIAFGDAASEEYIDLKNYAKNPARAAYGWTSNNSVFAPLGMKYDAIVSRIRANGEPGFAWLDNMRRYSRMGDPPDNKDARAKGGNPCLEQTLESYEMCCLVETFPANHADLDDFKRTLKYAYLYAKTVTLGRTHWPVSNAVMLRNRRIGCSMSGIAQFIAKHGVHDLVTWCEAGYATIKAYDVAYSDWLAIPRSIKTTCIKPSGTVSLLAGATPGVHHPESRYYIRRVRVGKHHEVVEPLAAAGYVVEPAAEDPDRKVVIEFPVDTGAGIRTLTDMTMWEQLGLAALLQRHWADNQVSCTITFDAEREGGQLARALDVFQYQLKGVSMLPRAPKSAYRQLPYEAMTAEDYAAAMARIRPVQLKGVSGRDPTAPDKFCDSSRCEVDFPAASRTAAADPEALPVGSDPSVSSRNLPSGLRAAARAAAAARRAHDAAPPTTPLA